MKKYELDTKWLQWFGVFKDAEGNFQIYPKKNVRCSARKWYYY